MERGKLFNDKINFSTWMRKKRFDLNGNEITCEPENPEMSPNGKRIGSVCDDNDQIELSIDELFFSPI